jgi:hypothetical protein
MHLSRISGPNRAEESSKRLSFPAFEKCDNSFLPIERSIAQLPLIFGENYQIPQFLGDICVQLSPLFGENS